ncbi:MULTISPECIES: DUF732 domain-containing protein [Mycobacteriaceae]|uniref:DUF732 domain-containing protein n=1 Tax=Mycolicibacterium parafortuitum TaxID=39692 RepID=A0ACC6MLA2_MYCPF|nr:MULTISPECIES: DUF732 domain-containing protein [Mycobacteriaceae]MDZ5087381.1 DUF732 domain-containing protein [Mycolicibacterium parafortuitum]
MITAITAAPVAPADQYDYVIALDNQGIYYESISDIIDIGKLACSNLRSGTPQYAGSVATSAGYSSSEVGIIILAATNNMCPDQIPTLRAYVQSAFPPSPGV